MEAREPPPDPLIFLVAGEPSGDQLGARLMAALRDETGGQVRFTGIGGEQMAAQGLKSQFPIAELALIGVFELLFHIPRVLRRIRETVDAVRRLRPSVVVTIDSPGFTLRVASRLASLRLGVPLVHYVAPTVWAWKAGRARKIARYLDRLLVVLPFEPPYFEVHGLASDFVGHPLVEGKLRGDGQAFRRNHNIPADAPVLCALPGSRTGEIKRLMPVYGETVRRLACSLPGLRVVIPMVPHVADRIREFVAQWNVPVALVGTDEKYDAFAAGDVALVKSGTSAVEVAVAGLPAVITVRFNPLTAWMARRMLKTDVSIVNVLLGERLQPELLQEDCTPEKLSAALLELFRNPAARQAQIEGGEKVRKMLGGDGDPPSHRAARAVLASITGPARTG